MNPEWQNFLSGYNANIQNNCVKDFSLSLQEEQAAYESMVMADLNHYGIIEAQGEDVVEFLQGQLTNDIKLVDDKSSQLSAYCNPKGRILANFRIFKHDNTHLLRLHSTTLAATLKRLRMFVMRSKVELSDKSDELTRIGIAGKNATNKLKDIFPSLPTSDDKTCNEKGITLIRLHGDLPRYEAHGSVENMKTLWQTLQNDAVLIGENSWNLLSIRSAIPDIVADTVEAFVPQMLNLQAINSLSFTKGCYPGQEVVARMHYLGKLKRRLFVASLKSKILPLPAQAIFSTADSEQKIGQVVSASWSNDNGVEILAVLQIEKAEAGALYLDDADKSPIQLNELPYSLEIE